jgi:hypothetical protein
MLTRRTFFPFETRGEGLMGFELWTWTDRTGSRGNGAGGTGTQSANKGRARKIPIDGNRIGLIKNASPRANPQ